MEKGKHTIDVAGKKVTYGHETITTDGTVILTTTFDLSKVSIERLLKRAADAELIAWRAKSGIKKLTSAEALAKFQDATIDCSLITERVKHVETEEEKAAKARVKEFKDKYGMDELQKLLEKAIAERKAREAEEAALVAEINK